MGERMPALTVVKWIIATRASLDISPLIAHRRPMFIRYNSSVILFLLASSVAFAADPVAKEKPTVYNPAADAAQEISNAVERAKRENKHVLLQIGGNWCGWCIKLEEMINNDAELKRALDDNYVLVHVNYSKEQENLPLLASLGFPQRFGFPVLVVLDAQNNRLHTQDSAYLEEGTAHSKKKVAGFLKQWSPSALDPKKYIKRS